MTENTLLEFAGNFRHCQINGQVDSDQRRTKPGEDHSVAYIGSWLESSKALRTLGIIRNSVSAGSC